MSRITEKEWLEDFQDFVNSEGSKVPDDISSAILKKVQSDLQPSSWLIFAKLLSIHAVVGTLSLGICNQFGLNPFHTDFSLSDYFMKFGDSTCMVLCGVLFVSATLLLYRFLVLPEELLILRKTAWLQIFGLSAISLGVFMALGAQITLAIAFLWLLGAMVGGTTIAMIPRRTTIFAL